MMSSRGDQTFVRSPLGPVRRVVASFALAGKAGLHSTSPSAAPTPSSPQSRVWTLRWLPRWRVSRQPHGAAGGYGWGGWGFREVSEPAGRAPMSGWPSRQCPLRTASYRRAIKVTGLGTARRAGLIWQRWSRRRRPTTPSWSVVLLSSEREGW